MMDHSLNEQIFKLFSSILDMQKKYQGIRPPSPQKQDLLREKVTLCSETRGQELFFNYVSSGKGHGPFTELIDGSVKYDLINGIGYNLLGHSHPLMIKANLEAALVDTMMCGNLQVYLESNDLALTLLKQVSQTKLKHFWFAGSGSFANDMALKMIWQKTAPRYNLLAFKKSFAGRSVAMQDVTDKPENREGQPQSINVKHVPHFNQNAPDYSLKNTLKALDQCLEEEGETFSALMIEMIQGEGGFVFGNREFYEGIFRWAQDKGIYIWVDEVQTFARTYELFAFQSFKLEEYVDIVTVGKVLHACGVLFSSDLNPRPNLIAGTFCGSIPSLILGKKILTYLTEGNFYGENGRIKEIEQLFLTKLNKLKAGSCEDKIKYVGGIGTMISFEVFSAKLDESRSFIKKLFENGIIAFTAGKKPTRIRFLLPLSLTNSHIDEIISIVEKTLLDSRS